VGRLFVLLDGGLPPLEEARDQGHLEACARCRIALVEHRAALVDVRAHLQRLSEDLEADTNAAWSAVEAALAPRPRSRARQAVLQVAAGFVGLLALGAGTTYLDAAPHSLHLAGPEALMESLPSWSEVLAGLEHLTARITS
jgi:anti-sigma factor RsiW